MAQATVSVFPALVVNFKPQEHVAGDRDFAGHGPHVRVKVEILCSGAELRAKVWMRARETRADWTEVVGTYEAPIYRFPGGVSVQSVANPWAEIEYTDEDHFVDVFERPEGPVCEFLVWGDQSGNDVRTETGVSLRFGPIHCTVDLPEGVEVLTLGPTPFFVPAHVAGDRDFDTGDGVFDYKSMMGKVSAMLRLEQSRDLHLQVSMEVEEQGGDHTRVRGTHDFLVFHHPRPIAAILSDRSSQAALHTSTRGWQVTPVWSVDPARVAGELVAKFRWFGDRVGNEAGTHTGVEVQLNPIFLRMKST